MSSKEPKDHKFPWWYTPPYRNEGHKVLNADGELVATFEDKDDALFVVSTTTED